MAGVHVRRLSTRAPPPARSAFALFERRQTRWNDTDGFGHINNVIYYAFMDDAVNEHLIRHGIGKEAPRFVAESSCRYFEPLTYPHPVDIGLRVERVGSSSVAYAIGIFDGGVAEKAAAEQRAAAAGTFVHVYVDEGGKPTPIAPPVRTLLESLVVRE